MSALQNCQNFTVIGQYNPRVHDVFQAHPYWKDKYPPDQMYLCGHDHDQLYYYPIVISDLNILRGRLHLQVYDNDNISDVIRLSIDNHRG